MIKKLSLLLIAVFAVLCFTACIKTGLKQTTTLERKNTNRNVLAYFNKKTENGAYICKLKNTNNEYYLYINNNNAVNGKYYTKQLDVGQKTENNGDAIVEVKLGAPVEYNKPDEMLNKITAEVDYFVIDGQKYDVKSIPEV